MCRISAALIVRDEEAYLADCISSLLGTVDEIVVVDTGSRDGTRGIADAAGARVSDFEWCDDFAAARNHAIEQATGDYVLGIDADERVANPREARRLLLDFAQRQGPRTVGTVTIRNLTGAGDASGEVTDETERFFPREGFCYAGAVHEQIMPETGTKTAAPTGLTVVHLGYRQAQDDPNHKAYRNLRILAKELEEHPEDEYVRYQQGKAYFSLGDYAAAAEALEAALKTIHFAKRRPPEGRQGPVHRAVLTDAVVSLAYALVNVGRTEEAHRMVDFHAGLGHSGVKRADFEYVRGYVALMAGELPPSRAAFEAALAMGPRAEDVRGTGSYSAAYQLGLLAEAEGDLPGAFSRYYQALAFRPGHEETLSRCVDLVVERRIVLPREVYDRCDQAVLRRIYRDRLVACIRTGNAEGAAVLVKVADAVSPDLAKDCCVVLDGRAAVQKE